MFTKLKLKIALEDYLEYNLKRYALKINCLCKDYRFEASEEFKPVIYNSTIIKDFKICTSVNIPSGKIFYYNNYYKSYELYLPTVKKMDNFIIYNFITDEERKQFLNNLIIVLMEWSNGWIPFFYDTKSELDINDDIIKITCNVIESDI